MNPRHLLCGLTAAFLSLSSARAGLVAYWPFNDSASLGNDAAGGSVLSANGGATHTAAGRNGGGLALNGSAQFLSGTVNNLPVGNSACSQSAWIKPALLGARGIVGWGNYGTARQVNALRIWDTGNGFCHHWGAADLLATGLATNLLNGSWHHVATTYDGTTRRIYLNGVQVAQDTPGANGAAAANFRIGSTNNGEFFNGTLDDVALYNHGLTAAEVQSLASGGSPLAPTEVILDDDTIRPENMAGDFLSTLSSPDPNAGEPHTFTLVSGPGSEENANFTIVGHQLRANTSFAGLTGVPQRIRIRSTDQSGLWVEASFVLTVQPKARGVVINEIHYNSEVNTVRNSFIELYNDGPATVDLTGWRISGGVDYLFPAGTTMAPNSYRLVAEDPATMLSYFGRPALGPWDNAVITYPDGSKEVTGLSNDGDNVRLRDATNNVVSEVDYENHSPWPAEGNGEGSSIELINPGLDESHGSNWRAAKGTSGAVPAGVTYISPATAGWKYFKGTMAPSPTWRDLTGADLTGWLDGTTTVGDATRPFLGFGFGDNDDAVLLSDMRPVAGAQPGYQGVYFRKEFTINAGEMPVALGLRVYVDDSCLIWINGVEIPVRFHCTAGTPTHNPADTTTLTGVTFSAHEAAPNNWDSYTINNLAPYDLVEGTNVIAILAANEVKTSSDFSFNLELKSTVRTDTSGDIASPGARNFKYATIAAPAIRKVEHTPQSPASSDAIVVTARITDPNGVASASLAWQICTAGNFIPATLPKTISGGNFVNVATPQNPNPAFENPANWTTVVMNDDGLGNDALGGDGTWTATIPPQPNRTLVRYRITATDNGGASDRVPYAGDPSLNFGAFVYNGVPAYESTPATALTAMPVYHFLTRKADFDQCVAYDANDSQRLSAGPS